MSDRFRTLEEAELMLEWITGDNPPDLKHWNASDWMNLHAQFHALKAEIERLRTEKADFMHSPCYEHGCQAVLLAEEIEEWKGKHRALRERCDEQEIVIAVLQNPEPAKRLLDEGEED